MDVVILPQLKNLGASAFGAPVRYRLSAKTPTEGVIHLEDRALTVVNLSSSDSVQLVFPPRQPGYLRDFFVRLVITADEVPEITFAAPEGETISFEDTDEESLACEIGINIFAFTETDSGIFLVNRKQIDLDLSVDFDACGGEMTETTRVYKLGAPYGSLPTPLRDGYTFEGWYTEATGGTRITSTDVVRTTVTGLYAQWKVYIDPFVDAICPAKNLTFHTSGAANWFVDTDTYASSPGAARSGAIDDNQSSEGPEGHT